MTAVRKVSMFRELTGPKKNELRTPCLLMDVDAVNRNIEKMAAFFSDLKCKLRPHAKTHKLPWIAHRQMRAGAIGITCAKLQDAKGFIEAGIENVLLANQVVGGAKIRELVGLSHISHVMVCIDDFNNAKELSMAAERERGKLDVLVEVDVGINRCGILPGERTLEFVKAISSFKGISFQGLMGYEGGLFNMDEKEKTEICRKRNALLASTKNLLEKSGFAVPVVSAGGSNTYRISGCCPGITDIQPGSYVTMDDWNAKHGIDFEQAVTVLSTTVSRPEKGRAIIDAGLKAISTDHGLPRIISHKGLQIEVLNEEHGKLTGTNADTDIDIGDKVELVPSHGCTTVPLYDHYIAMKDGQPIASMSMVSGSASY
jgi:D-serine deaminase-like pyridoxal phosphate-dependent protein